MSLRKIFFFFAILLLGILARPKLEHLILNKTAHDKPKLDKIYSRAAKVDGPMRNPVIVIPGMMGSKLVDPTTGRVLWGVFTSKSVDPSIAEDAKLISYPLKANPNTTSKKNTVTPAGVLGTLEINYAGIDFSQKAYLNILKMLGVGGYRDEELGVSGAVDYGDDHYTCFQFPYDWRLSNDENARKLHAFILDKKRFVEQKRLKKFGAKTPVKFDLVAHSMGGLIARYYLRYGNKQLETGKQPKISWAGANFVERLIMIGTPNRGSAKAIRTIQNGFSMPLIPQFESGIVGTFPAIYQLLPRDKDTPVVDLVTGEALSLFDVDNWDKRGWGLLNPTQDKVLQMLLPEIETQEERRKIAKHNLRANLQKSLTFLNSLDTPASPPPGLSIHLFSGDTIDTPSQFQSDATTNSFTLSATEPGDSTVTRKSSLGDTRTPADWVPTLQSPIEFRDIRFLAGNHFELTRKEEFIDNALFLLLEDPRKRVSSSRKKTTKM